jgi:predicted enzyme related to lactoylglutathione lyase
MSATTSPITGVDFVSVPTRDLARAMEFYGETLGLRRSVYIEGRPFAEFETGNLTLTVMDPEKMGLPYATNPNHFALHVEDVAAARAELEAKGVEFQGEIFDTGVCHMGFFSDPDGNQLMLHHRYAPRVTAG